MSSIIDNARSFLGLSLAETQKALGETAQVVRGDEYGQMKDLTSVEAPGVSPGTLYLKDDTVELVRIGPQNLTTVAPETLRAYFDASVVRLASRAGKTASLWVCAERGIAYSSQREAVHFIEVFRPRSQREYEAEIYKKPDHFLR